MFYSYFAPVDVQIVLVLKNYLIRMYFVSSIFVPSGIWKKRRPGGTTTPLSTSALSISEACISRGSNFGLISGFSSGCMRSSLRNCAIFSVRADIARAIRVAKRENRKYRDTPFIFSPRVKTVVIITTPLLLPRFRRCEEDDAHMNT